MYLVDYFDGTYVSPCFIPCLTTRIIGDIVTSKKWKNAHSYFDITFDQTVRVTESFYPLPSLKTLCADLGGSLGLWLGLGMLQLCITGIEFIKTIKAYFRK